MAIHVSHTYVEIAIYVLKWGLRPTLMHRTVVWSIRELAEDSPGAAELEVEVGNQESAELRVQKSEIKNAQSTSAWTSSEVCKKGIHFEDCINHQLYTTLLKISHDYFLFWSYL